MSEYRYHVTVARARVVGFEACGAASLDASLAAERRRRAVPWAVAALALLVALAALVAR